MSGKGSFTLLLVICRRRQVETVMDDIHFMFGVELIEANFILYGATYKGEAFALYACEKRPDAVIKVLKNNQHVIDVVCCDVCEGDEPEAQEGRITESVADGKDQGDLQKFREKFMQVLRRGE